MLQVGAVSYLNTKPLVHELESTDAAFKLHYDLPSRLADRLSACELDIALIPSVETFLQPNLAIISDACIACRGPVWSVKLFSRVPLANIRTLALDEGSRTSAALAKILLDQQHGIRPECRMLPIDQDWQTVEADAVLVIGDRAMNSGDDAFTHEVDLGEWWKSLTGLPFVFAVWAARPDVELGDMENRLSSSRDAGLRDLAQIASTNAGRYGLKTDRCLEYLKSNLHFVLGDLEKRALNLFYERAADLELVPEKRELIFHG